MEGLEKKKKNECQDSEGNEEQKEKRNTRKGKRRREERRCNKRTGAKNGRDKEKIKHVWRKRK